VFGSSYGFEGLSLLANTAATIGGMVVGSYVFKRTPEEALRAKAFFAQMEQPVQPHEVPPRGKNPTGPLLGISTFGVGALLALAGLISHSAEARGIDISIGAFFIAVGLLFYRQSRPSPQKE